jgi:hypothetical protein
MYKFSSMPAQDTLKMYSKVISFVSGWPVLGFSYNNPLQNFLGRCPVHSQKSIISKITLFTTYCKSC